MNKPASYFARLRHRKAPNTARKRNDTPIDGDVSERNARTQLRSKLALVREPQLANEF